MQEIELFLSRPGLMEEGARIGMTTACTAFAMVSVEPWLHWLAELPRSVRSVVPAPSEEKERQFGGSSHCPTGFVSDTLTHINTGCKFNVVKLPSSIACEKRQKRDHACPQRANSMAIIAPSR